jgi:hypothetical protein
MKGSFRRYVLFATLGHVVSKNSSHTSLSQLPGSIIIWILVTWLVSSFWISSQSHKDSHSSLSNTNPVLKRWRVIGLVGLVILGLFYLPCLPFYPVSAASVNAGEWTVEDSVNHTNWRPAEYTSWLGTRALWEPAALDSDPYLAPDLRYTLQPRVGMPEGRTPMENEDSVRILRQDTTCSGCRGSRHLMRMRSSASMCTINTIVLWELPASTAHSRLIYVLGDVEGADREDSNVSIDRLSYHPGIQKMC